MPRDTEEELKRLENWLLEEEEATDEQESTPLHNFDVDCKIYNSDRTDEDLEEFSQEILSPKKENLTWLMLIFVLLCLGILCVLLWWLPRWRGMIG